VQAESASVDADIQKDFARQREHLERSVASLKKKLEKDSNIHRADNVRIMQVNYLRLCIPCICTQVVIVYIFISVPSLTDDMVLIHWRLDYANSLL